jgi:transposase
MMKRNFRLSEKERQDLIRVYGLSENLGTRTRYQAVRLYGEGCAEAEIEKITGCSRTSLMEWCRAYREKKIQGLVDKRIGGNSAKLKKLQVEDLGYRLRQYTPRDLFGPESSLYWEVSTLRKAIRKWYQVEYQSYSSYVRLFGACNFSYEKVEKVYKPRA